MFFKNIFFPSSVTLNYLKQSRNHIFCKRMKFAVISTELIRNRITLFIFPRIYYKYFYKLWARRKWLDRIAARTKGERSVKWRFCLSFQGKMHACMYEIQSNSQSVLNLLEHCFKLSRLHFNSLFIYLLGQLRLMFSVAILRICVEI